MLNKLKEVRTSKGLSYEQMAIRVGISKPFYWQIENGDRRLEYTMAIRIAKVFNMKPDDLFYNDIKLTIQKII